MDGPISFVLMFWQIEQSHVTSRSPRKEILGKAGLLKGRLGVKWKLSDDLIGVRVQAFLSFSYSEITRGFDTSKLKLKRKSHSGSLIYTPPKLPLLDIKKWVYPLHLLKFVSTLIKFKN